MKAKQLIKKLQQFDSNSEVIVDGDKDGWFVVEGVSKYLYKHEEKDDIELMVSIKSSNES